MLGQYRRIDIIHVLPNSIRIVNIASANPLAYPILNRKLIDHFRVALHMIVQLQPLHFFIEGPWVVEIGSNAE